MLLNTEFKTQSNYRIQESYHKIASCMQLLSEAEIWFSPNAQLNSVGNLVQHLCGNITQYILSTLGKQADHRNRNAEFAISGTKSKQALLQDLQEVIDKSIAIIDALSEDALKEQYQVQVYQLSGIGIVLHVTEHLSYHTGQIAMLTKLITQKDLGFYAGLDLNKK